MFSTDIFYVLNGIYQKLASLPLLLALSCREQQLAVWQPYFSVKGIQFCGIKTFGLSVFLSTGALFASKDSKTSFEPPKNVR
jgi:hypothetical protein